MSEHRDEQNQGDLGFLAEMVGAVRADAPAERMWQDARRNLMGRLEACQQESIVTRVLRRSRSRKIGWAVALGVAAVVVALLVGLNPWARGPGQAYATVVEQFRNARTMTFTMTMELEGMPSMQNMQDECAFKEPGYMRVTRANGDVSIIDMTQKKAISLMPRTKQFVEMDLSDEEHQTAFDFFEKLRTLPNRADELLGEREMDGHLVQGFRVTEENAETIVLVDAETRDLVRVEARLGRWCVVMTDFQFNVDLDDALFSLVPPEGYTRLDVDLDASEPNEEDLIHFLRFWAENFRDGLFPPSFDPAKVMEFLAEEARARKAATPPDQAAEEEVSQSESLRETLSLARGTMFVSTMKPENDWHYAGEGVQLGEAATPICWWRPDGSETYRVVYGDLSIEDVAPEEVPSAQERQDTE